MTRIFGPSPFLLSSAGSFSPGPMAGAGYLIGPGDTLSGLLAMAYGSEGGAYGSPFMAYNGHLSPAQFDNLGLALGQPLYFPQMAALQALAAPGAGSPDPFSALNAIFAQSGMGPSAAGSYFASPVPGLPVGDPALAALIAHALRTGGAPSASGPGGTIDVETLLASLQTLERGAHEAIREGRTSQGPRGTAPNGANTRRALDESWTPARRPAQAGVIPMSQLDYNDRLGSGSRSIRQSGCFLTSMTMAATKITGDTSLDPRRANELVRQNGGFSGSNLSVDRAAGALGMRVTCRSPVTQGNASALGRSLDRALDSGRPVVAGVDYKAGQSSGVSAADHFVTITGRNADGTYSGIDPAGGKTITFRRGADGLLHSGKYTVSEMLFLDRRSTAYA